MAWWKSVMDRLRKLGRLSANQRRLLIKATVLLAMIRSSLWLLPFPVVRATLDRVSRRTRRLAHRPAACRPAGLGSDAPRGESFPTAVTA